jgi:monofunctional glycosyltransferase
MAKRKKIKKTLWTITKWVFILHVVVFGFSLAWVFSYKYINPNNTSLMLYRQYYQGVKNKPVIFVPLSHIDVPLRKVLIKLEDPSFRSHYGVDFDAIRMAYKLNKRYGRSIAGGSTITQQIARTLFLVPNKNYLRKYMELILALEMELVLSKNRILELYFNYVEFGKGVYGIGQASRHYFKRDISKLDVEQLTQLIIILPSPVKYSPKDIPKKRAFRKRLNILSHDPSLNRYVGGEEEEEQ